MNNPGAFAEAYWSINSLRIYNSSGKPVTDSLLTTPAIIGIAIGCFFAVTIPLALWWRYRSRRRARLAAMGLPEEEEMPQSYTVLAKRGSKSRPVTKLFEGETPQGFYQDESRQGSEDYLQPKRVGSGTMGYANPVGRQSRHASRSGSIVIPPSSRKSSGSAIQPREPRESSSRPLSTVRPVSTVRPGRTSRSGSVARPLSVGRPSSQYATTPSWVPPDVRKSSVAPDRKMSYNATSWAG